MPTPTRSAVLELAEACNRLQRLLDERELVAASALIAEVITTAKRLGVRSAFICFVNAIFADYSGDAVGAFNFIQEAIAMDAAAPPYRHSEAVIIRHLRGKLTAPDRDPADGETPRIWALLANIGEADDACHLALVRFHVAKGNDLEALRVVDAVTTLAPSNRDAWLLKASIATRLGDERLAGRARIEAAALDRGPVSFVVAAEAQG